MSQITHEDLRALFDVIERPEDYVPYGQNRDREEPNGERYRGDCSCGCKWFVPLDGSLRLDWGVCTNRASHRVGLLTFEHQGCPQYESDPDLEAEFARAAAASWERMRIERPHLYEKLHHSRGEPETEPVWLQYDGQTPVILLIDLPAYELRAGDLGTVIKQHANGAVYTVEFLSLVGKTIAMVEIEARHLRPALTDEIAHTRSLYRKEESDAH